MNHISQIIEEVVRKYSFEKKQKEAKLKEMWIEVVGEKLAECSSPVKIKKKTLYVNCTNSTGMQELCLLTQEIIHKINKIENGNLVEKIHLTIE